jgi:histidinol-phosphate/aromatic aminotransferase/cobyric acid decarboxylase-like protein
MQRTVAELSARRAELASRLGALGLRVLPSEANFLLCEVGPHAHLVEDKLLAEGLVVRKFATTGPLADYLRFTIRTDRAHDRLIDALERSL